MSTKNLFDLNDLYHQLLSPLSECSFPCWNSQINRRGSSPNQGSISGYILVLWAVIQSARHQYLLLPWHDERQKGGGGSHFGTGATLCHCQEIPPLWCVGAPPWDCCFLVEVWMWQKYCKCCCPFVSCVLESLTRVQAYCKNAKG